MEAKYKVGDKVRIAPIEQLYKWSIGRGVWAGKTMTVRSVEKAWYSDEPVYRMVEDNGTLMGDGFAWYEDDIAGYAKCGQEPLTVELCFDGAATTATLKRGGRAVKTVKAICNPKDTYSRGEGAKVAVERLFAKKKSEAEKAEAAKAHCRQVTAAYKNLLQKKIGDKFVVKTACSHAFPVGTVVTLIEHTAIAEINVYSSLFNGVLISQVIADDELEPYRG